MRSNEVVQQAMFSKIREWQQSGITQKGWCEKHQIKYHVFHYWYKRYRNDASPTTKNQFIALQIEPAATAAAAASGCMELLFADGKRLLFHQLVSADYLKALIR